MQLRRHEKSRRNFRFAAIISLIVGAIAIGVGPAGDAIAIDQPTHLRKAVKKKDFRKAKGVELGPNQATAMPTIGPKRGTAGASPLGKHALGKHAIGKHTLGKDPPHTSALGKHALGKQGADKHAVGKHALRKHADAKTVHERRRLQIEHRREILTARLRLPHRPLPGERGFTGVPPAGETRFVPTEMVFQVPANVSRQTLDNAVRRLGLSSIGSQNIGLTGGTLFHFQVADGRAVADVVRALEAENIGIAQPNYVYQLRQDSSLAARTDTGGSSQYVVSKLRLGEVHQVATGSNVLVAVIDTAV